MKVISSGVVFLAGAVLHAGAPPISAVEPQAKTQAEAAADKIAERLSPEQFGKMMALIKPKPGGFADVPWLTSLWEARTQAAAQGKPILLWVGDGHPLGWT